ncbi:hypothetical protein CLIB1444_03S00628 [[Candida] jaroonii]|uniref:Uncharacterized protein n=1 Tax=[Candida] jaroonii TaxID=467808 RepID=A0ACA9Y4M2_9ASCO|nr:hypothetical protein CLIB1444_03S00628 [[Candida] jaroonii]
MELPTQLINWLYNVLQPQYLHKQIVYTHVLQFLQKYFSKGFRIRTRVYTSGKTGSSNLLINIYGKLPVADIPVEIWLPLNYPFNGNGQIDGEDGIPMIYVVPDNTQGLFLKPNNFVDSQGKFYHPYITDWHQNCRAGDLNSTKRFNLLVLIDTVSNAFQNDFPIYKSTGPTKPPKPSRVLNHPTGLSSELTGSSVGQRSPPASVLTADITGSRSSNGPPLPLKPFQGSTKQVTTNPRYQSPLPLPSIPSNNEASGYNRTAGPPFSPLQSPLHSRNSLSPYRLSNSGNLSQSPTQDTSSISRADQSPYPTSQSPPIYESVLPKVSIDNLMDQDGPQKSKSNTVILERLSQQINELLTDLPENFNMLEVVNTNSMKVEGLYNQLNHHYSQAIANKEYIDSHITYLTDQLTKVSELNSKLYSLSQINNDDENHIHFPEGKISLDELVIPDSVLTNQLYDISSEIKANKDLIGLISGNFSDKSELINDERFDVCVKAARNIGRDMFWLELIKNEISKKMSISS